MQQTLIRAADARDGNSILDLSVRAWRPVFESFRSVWGEALYERFYPDWSSQQRADVSDALDTNPTWVAIIRNDVAGFVNVAFNDETRTGEIFMVAVDPNHQHRGLGHVLTQHALSEMRSRGMTLAVVSTGGDPGHEPARRTYERSGFTPFPQVLYSMLLEPNPQQSLEALNVPDLRVGQASKADGDQGIRSERVEYHGIEPHIYASIRSVLGAAFEDGDDGESLEDFSDFDQWFVLSVGDEIAAVAGILVRDILVGDQVVTVAGIGGVATVRRHRSKGYASRLVNEATRYARGHTSASFGVLQCEEDLAAFYVALGWRTVDADLLCKQNDGNTYQSPEMPMVIQLASSDWPPGSIDMNGLPW